VGITRLGPPHIGVRARNVDGDPKPNSRSIFELVHVLNLSVMRTHRASSLATMGEPVKREGVNLHCMHRFLFPFLAVIGTGCEKRIRKRQKGGAIEN
jgi:hypothetical protein